MEAQYHLAHSVEITSSTNIPAEERLLFLQAESFYRYRFKPPKHNTKSFLAEAAATITDFPAFQSLAGSFSLLDLRLRSSDSAIQIWETLLLRHPQTQLRPLILYRLGWAYRYASVEGLPRKFPNEPFDELIKEQPKSSLSSLALEAKEIPWKSKSKAATRSLFPGLGQIYVDETHSGLIRMGIAVGALAAIIIPAYKATHKNTNWKNDWPLLATGIAGLIVLSFDYTSSYEDAMRGVVDWNERAESKFNHEHPEAP
ncbi:MAG: hypothetical protein K2Q18_06255 [Bdellovibrionales bacterium]|nr:hypothetical protein [Bdellovibrionales bacterium]